MPADPDVHLERQRVRQSGQAGIVQDPREGLYDQILSDLLRQDLKETGGLKAEIEGLEAAELPDYLLRYLAPHIRRALAAIKDPEHQLALTNQLMRGLTDELVDPLTPPPELLKSLYRGPQPPARPKNPLSASALVMNARELSLGHELEAELQTADRVLMLVSFLQWRGWQRLKPAFDAIARAGRPVRVLTTTYIGASDFHAIHALASLPNVELKISLDSRRRRLHAKAWLFQRNNGFGSAYVGSANLSGPALEEGIEWTVKLSEVEAPHILTQFQGAFDTLWEEPEFELYHPPDEAQAQRIRTALESAKGSAQAGPLAAPLFFDLRPHPYQQATLDQLTAERLDRNRMRNLIVAPTGTGKTLIAAFDYARQSAVLRPRLLFLAHREEILSQAIQVFRHVLRDQSFGELLAGGRSVLSYDYLFATVQSVYSQGLVERMGRDYWQYTVLDEAHHVPAESYADLIKNLRPQILLGLTATPERLDGTSILPWFDNEIADEMRLWHAIERQYLSPFDYYGIHDGVDLSDIPWQRGGYNANELSRRYASNLHRAALIFKQFHDVQGNPLTARALGFCVSVEHAEFMADYFTRHGIPSLAVTSRSPADVRESARQRLRNRDVNVLFTVDLFNEGVDIPEVDCLLLLRPTESATVYIQQIGRGLRLHKGKTACLILDFLGNQNKWFRFDLRFRALFGGTRQQVREQLEAGQTPLPGNCYFRLDQESRQVVLENLKATLGRARQRIIEELRAYGNERPTLGRFLQETQFDLADIYKNDGSWSSLLADAGLATAGDLTDADLSLSARFKFLLHLDGPRRLKLYRSMRPDHASGQERRLFEMLTLRILQGKEARQQGNAWDTSLLQLEAAPMARREFGELMDVLLARTHLHTAETPYRHDWPLYLHRHYHRDEILAAVGYSTLGHLRSHREGVLYLKDAQTELLFITLEKTERHFSPTTRYQDFAVSATRFHWQSQSTTSVDSGTGRRYRERGENATKFLLFVRPKPNTAYMFLGPAQYHSHTGSRPMTIYWDLEHEMPAVFYEQAVAVRSA